jgi:UDP-N-acetylglucosamine pyrophosphorylase
MSDHREKANHFPEFADKMRNAGSSDAAIRAFQHSYDSLIAGQTGMIPEGSIQPITDLPYLQQIRGASPNPALLSQSIVIKLNGGLGTSMGLERAKSLLQAKNSLTFLDFIVKQILHLQETHKVPLRFLLMNSFSTSRDTREFLRKYSALGEPASLELMQNQVPKVDARTFRPASWPENGQLEWCPPGHGDLYPSLLGSGVLERFLADNVKFLFVSNSDNLGATLDLSLLTYFVESGKPFLMEVAERTLCDRKGGHLAQRDGKLLLRESAQCPEADQAAFQDIQRHRFFNTNNLWLRLDALKELLDAHGGFVPLPLIKNAKTVDPRNKSSLPVFQLETAMGAAIESFQNAGAIVVPRRRFAPVKTTSDLLALRSDAYCVTGDWQVVLANGNSPPTIDLDGNHYKMVDQLDEKFAGGCPSLKECRELIVRGPILFNSGNVFRGKVSLTNKTPVPRSLPAGEYRDCSREL